MLRMNRLITTFFFILLLFSTTLWSHGTMEVPISRVYNCFKENPENPRSAACRAAVAAGGKQALYDWNGVNQGAANDRHQELIPDGKLCSAGRDLFKGLDLPRNDWPTTTIAPNANRQFDFLFRATAPHSTRYFRLYVTKSTYNHTQPLRWADLEAPFCTINQTPPLINGQYKITCPFPAGTGKRVLYMIWQRLDSAEAFYSCSDVVLSGGGGGTPVNWHILGDLYANAAVTVNSSIRFRLFRNGSEAVNTLVRINDGQNLAHQWPYYLAERVNANSNLVHIGQLNAAGNVVPAMSATANKVYVDAPDLNPYRYAIDIIPPNDQIDYIYPDGIGSYVAGTVVMGSDHRRYECKPWPASNWCNQSPAYYEPGRGLAWQEAWNVIG